jgi:Spy/CpxP family protein refolding chaperone
MKTGKLMLALAMTGLIATGGIYAWANESAAEDKPAKKQVEAGKGERGPRGEGPWAERRGEMTQKVMETIKQLNLSEEQKAELKQIHEDAKVARETFKAEHGEELKALHEEMKAARQAKDIDKAKEIGGKIRELMAQGPSPKDTMDKVKAVLTPEQQEQLKAKLEKFRENHPRLDPEKRKDKKDGGEEPKPRKRQRPDAEPKP